MVLFMFLAFILGIQCCVKIHEFFSGAQNLESEEDNQPQENVGSEIVKRRLDSQDAVVTERGSDINLRKHDTDETNQIDMISPLKKKRKGQESYKFEFSD